MPYKIEIDDDEITDYVAANFQVDDVFPKEELEEWAENNGFVKEEEK